MGKAKPIVCKFFYYFGSIVFFRGGDKLLPGVGRLEETPPCGKEPDFINETSSLPKSSKTCLTLTTERRISKQQGQNRDIVKILHLRKCILRKRDTEFYEKSQVIRKFSQLQELCF